jgi:hypothetical protein
MRAVASMPSRGRGNFRATGEKIICDRRIPSSHAEKPLFYMAYFKEILGD